MRFATKGLIGSADAGMFAVASRVGLSAQEDAEGDDGTGLEGLGESIETTVTDAVAPIAGDDDDADDDGIESGTTDGGDVTTIDESQGLAIADASGGDNNFAFVS